MDGSAGNSHLHFTAEIWTDDKNLPPSGKKDNVQISDADKFPFLDMKISWSPEGSMRFVIFGTTIGVSCNQ